MPQDELSTTRAPDDPLQRCPSNCAEALALAQEEVNRIARIDDPLERNAAITRAYRSLGEAAPRNRWVRLAGYVSSQAGCAMERTQAWDAQTVGRVILDPEDAMDALQDGNMTIFESVYPPNKFMQNCGFERLQECVASGEIDVPEELMEGLELVHRGELRRGADAIAEYEQNEVVQPVYQRHERAFGQMARAESWVPGDQTSIPVAYECTRDDLVDLGDLDISNSRHRVRYYHLLMDRMMRMGGTP